MLASIQALGKLPFPRALGKLTFRRASSSTLRVLQHAAANDDPSSRRRLPTVYVTGFLTDTSKTENYREWLTANNTLADEHRIMDEGHFGWSRQVYGLEWRTGHGGDWLGRYPLPLHVAVMLIRRSSPAALAASVMGDAVLNASRLYLTFRAAEREAAGRDAESVAASLANLSASSEHGYRVVAHSLGCRLMLVALPLLPAEARPCEFHLCAAAVTPTYAAPKLPLLCKPDEGRIFHHWSAADEALTSGFLLASRGEPALGSGPLPPSAPPNATSHDASTYLGLASHGAYRREFNHLAAGAILGIAPPPRQQWLVRQQTLLAEQLTRALKRLPSVPTTWGSSAASLSASASAGASHAQRWILRGRGWLPRSKRS